MSEQALLDAASRLKPEDLAYLQAKDRQPQVAQVEPPQEPASQGAGPDAASEPAAPQAAPAQTGAPGKKRTRRPVKHSWPSEGAKLKAKYFGVEYLATVIPATKKLKSGKQIKIETGPAASKICDSFSEAMLLATEQQRRDQNLGRKKVANGWAFWHRTRA